MITVLDAIARLDDGTAFAGDRELAALFDAHASDNWYRRLAALDTYDADRCVTCGTTGEGPECDHCTTDHDYTVARTADV